MQEVRAASRAAQSSVSAAQRAFGEAPTDLASGGYGNPRARVSGLVPKAPRAASQQKPGWDPGGRAWRGGLWTGGRGPRVQWAGPSWVWRGAGKGPRGGARGGERWAFARGEACPVRSLRLRLRPGEAAPAGQRRLHPRRPACPRLPIPRTRVGARGGGGGSSASSWASGHWARTWESGGGAGRRIARRAVAWTGRAMAAPELVPRRGREREREDESEDESDILEESPCGRWQKRREQVGTAGRGGSPPTSGGAALGPRGAVCTLREPGGWEPA